MPVVTPSTLQEMRNRQANRRETLNFSYLGHGPKATGFFAKTFQRKPGLYARCTECGYLIPLLVQQEEFCECGNLHMMPNRFVHRLPADEIEIFKSKRG